MIVLKTENYYIHIIKITTSKPRYNLAVIKLNLISNIHFTIMETLFRIIISLCIKSLLLEIT